MEDSTATIAEDQDQCMVCLNACLSSSEHVWTCGCCNKRCHLLCIFQWTLRISLNRSSRTVTTFSCPGCRTDHAISGLPGFAQQRASARSLSTTGNTSTNVSRSRRRVVSSTTVEDEDEEEGEDLDETEEDDEDEEEDDDTYEDGDFIDEDEDEDEDEDDFDDRCFSSVSTKDIYIEIGQLTINIAR